MNFHNCFYCGRVKLNTVAAYLYNDDTVFKIVLRSVYTRNSVLCTLNQTYRIECENAKKNRSFECSLECVYIFDTRAHFILTKWIQKCNTNNVLRINEPKSFFFIIFTTPRLSSFWRLDKNNRLLTLCWPQCSKKTKKRAKNVYTIVQFCIQIMRNTIIIFAPI